MDEDCDEASDAVGPCICTAQEQGDSAAVSACLDALAASGGSRGENVGACAVNNCSDACGL